MQLPQAIVAFADGPESVVALAAATAISTLLDIDQILLMTYGQKNQDDLTEAPVKLPKQSVLVLSQAQINQLAGLRLRGFSGAVLVLSTEPFHALKAKYKILRWGQGSHEACQSPWELSALIEAVTELVPLEPENLKMLQKELKAPERWFQRQVVPCLKRLEKQQGNLADRKRYQARQDAIASLSTIIEKLRSDTPVVCHAVVEIAGRSAQIQQHFQILIEAIAQSQADDATQIALLRQVFEQWRILTLDGGEGLGAFS